MNPTWRIDFNQYQKQPSTNTSSTDIYLEIDKESLLRDQSSYLPILWNEKMLVLAIDETMIGFLVSFLLLTYETTNKLAPSEKSVWIVLEHSRKCTCYIQNVTLQESELFRNLQKTECVKVEKYPSRKAEFLPYVSNNPSHVAISRRRCR